MIITNNSRTQWVHAKLGVPLGSVLGPLLFILYTADISSLSYQVCGAAGHLFADDVQSFVHFHLRWRSSQLLLVARIQSLTNCLHSWMSSNRLNLNASKTQFIWFGSPQQLQKLDFCFSLWTAPTHLFLVKCPGFVCYLPLLGTSLISHTLPIFI